jgi:hypothetical protein
MKTRNHRRPSCRAHPRPGMEVLGARLLLSGLQGVNDVSIMGPAPVSNSAATPTGLPLPGMPSSVLPAPLAPPSPPSPPTAIPTPPPLVGLPSGPVPPAAPAVIPGTPIPPTGPGNHIPPSTASVPGTPTPPIAELIPLNGSPLAFVVTLSSVVPAPDAGSRSNPLKVGRSIPRVAQPISLARLEVGSSAGEMRALLDQGNGGPPLVTIAPGDRPAVPASDEPQSAPSSASAASVVGPSTSETASPTPVSQDSSALWISLDEPEQRHSHEASEKAVVLAALAAFAWLVIRNATLAAEDSSDEISIRRYPPIRLLDSMSGS